MEKNKLFKKDEKMETIKENLNNEYKKELTELSKKIKNLTKAETKITKQEFETYLLPYILGEVEHNDINNTIFINNLKDLSGGYRVTLTVVDENDETLFSLPPMIIDVNNEKLEKNKLRGTIMSYKDLVDSNPRAADLKIRSLTNIILNGLDPDNNEVIKFKNELNKIFDYYKDRLKSKDGQSKILESKDPDFIDEIEF